MPKAELPLWQRLERALVKIAKGYKYECDEDPATGDKVCNVPANLMTSYATLSLTELAKDLEKELER